MAEGYSWNYARGRDRNRLPGPEHLGWWAAVAMLLSICLHGLVFFLLERMEVAWSFQEARELRTASVNVRQVHVQPMPEAVMKPEEVIAPSKDTASLLEEVDLLAALPKDQEIDIAPNLAEASYALRMNQPKADGETSLSDMHAAAEVDMDAMLPEIGVEVPSLPPAAGQVVVDPGSRLPDDGLGKLAEDLLNAGDGGNLTGGSLDGLESLDKLLDLPPNILLSKKTMLPSDLLFEFNRAELRESAKIGLMKLALLMDRNPGLYCWIEGHTDLIGGDAFNRELSLKRANAVKDYLVDSMRMDSTRIITRGFGREQPIVSEGDAEAQAPNRRVEIRMRKTPPSDPPATESEASGGAPRAVLVKPGRALPVEELEAQAPRAKPVDPESLQGTIPRAELAEPKVTE